MEKGRVLVAKAQKEVWMKSLKLGRAERIQVWQRADGSWRARAYHYSDRQAKGGGPYSLLVIELKDGQVTISCQCRGWGYHGYCKHSAVLATRLAHSGKTVRLDITPAPNFPEPVGVQPEPIQVRYHSASDCPKSEQHEVKKICPVCGWVQLETQEEFNAKMRAAFDGRVIHHAGSTGLKGRMQ